MRHLGKVRKILLQTPTAALVLSKMILTEMVMRVCKSILNKEMRQRMLELSLPRDRPFINVILSIYNLISTFFIFFISFFFPSFSFLLFLSAFLFFFPFFLCFSFSLSFFALRMFCLL